MTVTQRLMKPGTFRLSLKPGAPHSITSAITVLDHIVITATRTLGVPFADAVMLSQAIYTGVVVNRPSRTVVEGCDPSWWLGTPAGRGVITSPITQVSAATLSTWLGAILPFNGITAGTISNIGTASHAATYQYVTRREAIDTICRIAGAEWRMRPNFTLDAGITSALFRTTDPTVVVTRKKGGPDGGRFGVETAELNAGLDASNLATSAILVGPTGTATASAATTYKTPANGTPNLAMTVDGGSISSANMSALASATLAAAGGLKTTLTLTTRSYQMPVRLVPGDTVYAYDPESGLVGASSIFYRGEVINAATVRCMALTWPIEQGMGVYVRKSAATPTYVDITDWVQFESDVTSWEVGGPDAPYDDAAPSPARLGANPQAVAMTDTIASSRLVGQYTGITGFGTKTTNFNGYPRMITDAGAAGTFIGLGGSALEVFQANANADAFITFHVSGDFAAHFGLDGASNDLFFGGWSVGAVKNRVFHAGNGWRRVERQSSSCDVQLTVTTSDLAVSGTLLSFANCLTGDELVIRAVFDVNITAWAATQAVFSGKCYVNGVALGPVATFTGAGTATNPVRSTVAAQWVYVVPSPGTYNIQLYGSKTQNTGTIDVRTTHTTILVERYSKG